MKIISILEDKRIKSHNILIEFKIREYLDIARQILNNNPFQRKRVKSSSTVYSLLRNDLKEGCIIPPIVLAITKEKIDLDIESSQTEITFSKFLQNNIKNVIILDGLQRTYNIIEVEEELNTTNDKIKIENYYSNKIRCEFYLGIDKIGILYRMLTLNTGQTPMSLRHQIEILYSDYLTETNHGIHLLKETDEKIPRKPGEYNFKDMIEGFVSYLMRDYLTFDKSDILDNIKSLEKLSKENQSFDLFRSYTTCYNDFQIKIQKLIGDWEFTYNEHQELLSGPAYGKNAKSIFDKSQSMTGMGAAIGFLLDLELIKSFEDVILDIPKIHFSGSIDSALTDLLYKLDDIRKNAPKIGNAQRAYFFYLYRELFNKQGDSYLIIDKAIDNAFRRYRQNA